MSLRVYLALLAAVALLAAGCGPRQGEVQVRPIEVTDQGYRPASIELQAGRPARLIFTRTSENTCATQIQFPGLEVTAVDLPLNRPVIVEFTPARPGEFTFTCGMKMIQGRMVIHK
ncbi:MAG TPA: cupredoxin domain-containing protein [Candidatus Nitrosotenuis sp.]|nr:cupredoxin domain-containing protein [Candidatus Nitrosotenuis sp.]